MENLGTVSFVAKLRRDLNLNSDLLLRLIINLDPVLEKLFKMDVLTEKRCSQKHRQNSPRKSGSHCLWVHEYVNEYVCLCTCSCMHVNTHCLCVMGLVSVHSKSCILCIFCIFQYANRKFSVKK